MQSELKRRLTGLHAFGNIFCTIVSRRSQPEAAAVSRLSAFVPIVKERIVTIQHGGAALRQFIQQFAFGCRDVGDTAKSLQMCRGGIRDNANLRSCDLRQRRNFPRMVSTHFQHGRPVMLAQFQDRQRQADVIIQVTLCGQYRVVGVGMLGPHNRRDHFLHRGLAIAARDCNNRQLESGSPRACEYTQSLPGVRHLHLRQFTIALLLNYSARRPATLSFGNELRRIVLLASQRKKQLARRQ